MRKLIYRLYAWIPSGAHIRLRRIPVLSGMARRILDAELPEGRSSVVQVTGGPLKRMHLELAPRTMMGMVAGRYEEPVVDTLVHLLSPGCLAFDVGAHIGYLALVMARSVEPGGRVVAFEPNPDLIGVLRKNVERNQRAVDATISVSPCAVAETTGTVRLAQGRDLYTAHISADDGGIEVESVTLDGASEHWGLPDVVKVDAEGAEVGILEAAAKLLANARTAFVIEAHSDDNAIACELILRKYPYDIHAFRASAQRPETHIVARPRRATESSVS